MKKGEEDTSNQAKIESYLLVEIKDNINRTFSDYNFSQLYMEQVG